MLKRKYNLETLFVQPTDKVPAVYIRQQKRVKNKLWFTCVLRYFKLFQLATMLPDNRLLPGFTHLNFKINSYLSECRSRIN